MGKSLLGVVWPATTGELMNEDFILTLFSCDSSEKTGWGRFTREFCLALHKESIPFELHLPKTTYANPSLPFIERIRFDLPPMFLSIKKRWWRCPLLWWESRQIRIAGNIIHSLIEFPYGVVAYWTACRYGLPFGLTVHGTYAVEPLRRFPDRWLYKSALENAEFVSAVSKFTAQRLVNALGFAPPLTVIPNGVNFSLFAESKENSNEVKGVSTIASSREIILCVGALKPRKGITTLLEAFAKIVEQAPSTHLIIVGFGNKHPYLQMAEGLGIGNRVTFLSDLTDQDLIQLYRKCKVFALLPREDRRDHFEGFGLVYLEANSCGKPVVGTRSGGVPDAVLDGVTGFLVPPDNPQKAAEAILKLLRDEKLRQDMGKAGRKWAQEHDWSRIIGHYFQVYKKAMEGNRKG